MNTTTGGPRCTRGLCAGDPDGFDREPTPEEIEEIRDRRIEVHRMRAAAALDEANREAELNIAEWLWNPVGPPPPSGMVPSACRGRPMEFGACTPKHRKIQAAVRCPECGGMTRAYPCMVCHPLTWAEVNRDKLAENDRKNRACVERWHRRKLERELARSAQEPMT